MPNVHYDPAWTSAPVAGATTIRCVFVLMLMTGAYAHIVDVMGAFLLGQFQNGEQIFTPIPEGWERFFPVNVLLLLMKTIHGLKQAANCFYILLVATMKKCNYTRSVADPALFYRCDNDEGLMLWLSWTDDSICVGKKEKVYEAIAKVKTEFEVDDVGQLLEYLGSKIDIIPDIDPNKPPGLRFTQPVLPQSLIDMAVATQAKTTTPATSGSQLHPPAEGEEVGACGQDLTLATQSEKQAEESKQAQKSTERT